MLKKSMYIILSGALRGCNQLIFQTNLMFPAFHSIFPSLCAYHLYGPAPGLEVLLSRLDAKLHVADVRAELPGLVAVKCSVLCVE